MTRTELLEDYIKRSGMKKCYLAERVGLTPQGFYKCLKNPEKFRAGQAGTLCELLRIEMGHRELIFFATGGV